MADDARVLSQPAFGRREAVLTAARNQFARRAYEQVGLRDIGAEAGIDPTQIVREFGSKEQLFGEALRFAEPPVLRGLGRAWPEVAARTNLLGDATEQVRVLPLVVHSISSPVAGEIIRADINDRFLSNLRNVIEDGPDWPLRVTLAAAIILGVTAVTQQFRSESLTGDNAERAVPYLAAILAMLQTASEPETPPAARPVGSAETRAAILQAAKAQFAEMGYEHATVRGIAAAAEADPALVIRYFGSKEALFLEAMQTWFSERPAASMLNIGRGELLARHVVHGSGEMHASLLQMALRSVSSPSARGIVCKELEDHLLTPIAAEMSGPDACVRAGLVMCIVLGVNLTRDIVGIEPLRREPGALFTHLIRIFSFLSEGPSGPAG